MNGRRAKWIRKQLVNGNTVIFLAVRTKAGGRTERMAPRNIYQIAKKLWTSGEADKALWKKEWKMPPNIPEPQTT